MLSSEAWRNLWWLGFLGFLPLVIPGTGDLRVFLLFFFAPLVADLVALLRRRREPSEESINHSELPLPGPAERSGAIRFLLRYELSTVLMLLNPFQLAQAVRQVRGEAAVRRRIGEQVPEPNSYRQKVEYRLPFAGEWFVMNGGVTRETSHSWDLLSQRYAYDFVIADEAGKRHQEGGTRKEHYFCYGEPVLAPADGVAIHVRDGVRDAPGVGTGWVDWLCRDFGGNSVTLQHAEGEYSHSAHLIPGSITVHPGEKVRCGQRIGLCGHSGHSTEPHLHFQVQDHADFFQAVGLPIAFFGCCVNRELASEPVYLHGGMRVRHEPATAARTSRAP